MRRWISAFAIGIPLSLAVTLLLFVAPLGGTKLRSAQSWRWLGNPPADWTTTEIPVGAAVEVFSTPGIMARVESYVFGGTGISQDTMRLAIGAPFFSFVSVDSGIILPPGTPIAPQLPNTPRWRGIVANALIFACMVYGVLWLGARAVQYHRRRRGRCIYCGYPQSQPQSRCPECGKTSALSS